MSINSIHYFFFFILVFFSISCEEEKEVVEQLENDHLQYFGFTLVDTHVDDPTDSEVKDNYIDEVATFSNVADIAVFSAEDNIIRRVADFSNVQVKAILHLNELFFRKLWSCSIATCRL